MDSGGLCVMTCGAHQTQMLPVDRALGYSGGISPYYATSSNVG